eukprot:4510655-Pyramimonas_sp.AAC.1
MGQGICAAGRNRQRPAKAGAHLEHRLAEGLGPGSAAGDVAAELPEQEEASLQGEAAPAVEDDDEDDEASYMTDRGKYTVDTMIACMQLHRLLRNPDRAKDAFKICARALLGRPAADTIAKEIDEGAMRVPHRVTTARNFVRSDVILMLWRRKLLEKGRDVRISRYITIDSSPQGGYDYFMAHE